MLGRGRRCGDSDGHVDRDADADPAAARVTDAISEAVYEGKLDQFDAERSTAAALSTALADVDDGLGTFVAGSESYRDGDDGDAEEQLATATETLGRARDALPTEPADPHASLVEDLGCVLAAVDLAARELELSAQEGGMSDREAVARDFLRGCDRVTDAPTIDGFADWLDEQTE